MPEYPITTYAIVALGAVILFLLVWIIRLEMRMEKIFKGKNAQDLEDLIGSIVKDVNSLKGYKRDATHYLQDVEERLRKSVQYVETVRFNPFKGVGIGGDQSFSTAFVSEKGDGVVMTGLHTRDRISVFAKPVKGFASEHELSDEEKHVIERAKSSLSR
jgi:hypothetical protein